MDQFLKEVLNDLSRTPKTLNSKYFYDEKGDKLFQEIMDCPEYYPTNCEMEIFTAHTKDLALTLKNGFNTFDLVELGAGDATKSSFLLKELMDMKVDFTYMPIDISSSMISHLEETLPQKLRDLKYRDSMANILKCSKRLILFLTGRKWY